MSPALPLGSALKRGAWMTLANWQAVFVEFAIESLYKLALGVAVIGGAFMVGGRPGVGARGVTSRGALGGAPAPRGARAGDAWGGSGRRPADLVIGSLTAAPLAL